MNMNLLVVSNDIIAQLKINYLAHYQFPQLKTKKLWLYALTDAIAKLNNVPRKHLAWTSPYTKWFNKEYDFTNKPLLPFGCKFMAHNPVDTQSKLSDNATLHYYVGPAPHTKQGILLYNPKTKLVIIRRSFQPLDHEDLNIPCLPISMSHNNNQDLINDNEDYLPNLHQHSLPYNKILK